MLCTSSKETQIEWIKEKENQWELTECEEIKCRGNEKEGNNKKEKGEKKKKTKTTRCCCFVCFLRKWWISIEVVFIQLYFSGNATRHRLSIWYILASPRLEIRTFSFTRHTKLLKFHCGCCCFPLLFHADFHFIRQFSSWKIFSSIHSLIVIVSFLPNTFKKNKHCIVELWKIQYFVFRPTLKMDL